MNIHVEIAESESVKAGDVYLTVKSKSGKKILGHMIQVVKGEDGQDYAFVVLSDGSIHRIRTTFITVVDADYIATEEVPVEEVPKEEIKDAVNDWWNSSNNLWDKFKSKR